MTTYLVVGDAFSDFIVDPRVLKASDFLGRLETKDLPSDVSFVLGQGIDESLLRKVRALANTLGIEDRITFPGELAPLSMTHKHDERNVMITRPTVVGPHRYRFALSVEAQADRLSDHVTGSHIGGMVLLEAARQCVVAVLELEYMGKSDRRWGFLWNTLHIEFRNFAAPVPTLLDVHVAEKGGEASRSQIATEITIRVSQDDILVCEIDMGVTLCESGVLRKIESRRAKQSIEALLKRSGATTR